MKALLFALLFQLPPPGDVPRMVLVPIDGVTFLRGPITSGTGELTTVYWLLWTHADPDEAAELAISLFRRTRPEIECQFVRLGFSRLEDHVDHTIILKCRIPHKAEGDP